MKRYLFAALIIALTVPSFAQSKYYIYFKDKGSSAGEILKKSSSDISEAYKYLSPRSIERKKRSAAGTGLTYEDLPVYKNYINIVESNGIKIENKLKWFNAVTAYLNEGELSLIKTLPFVSSIAKVKTLYYEQPDINNKYESGNGPIAKVNDLDYGLSLGQYELSDIPAVHNAGINGSGILIGILDTGFDWNRHESLNTADVVAEYDFVFKDDITANEDDEDGVKSGQHNHGTAVFSVIGGYKPGRIIGPAYGSSFVLAKTEDIRSETHVEEDNYAAALEWMDSLGVDITTASLGYATDMTSGDDYTFADMDGKTTIVTKAAELAFQKGILVLNAAGNERLQTWGHINAPADGFNVIAVGAVNTSNELASFSSPGPTYDGRIKPEITADGVSVYGASAGTVSSYGYSNGTSLATPIASGVAALLLSAYPHLTNVQMRNILLYSSPNWENPNNDIGYGLVSAKNAINFPNMEYTEGELKLNKAFIGVSNIDSNSVTVVFPDSVDIETRLLLNVKPGFYSTDITGITKNYFYITYKDAEGNNFREPVSSGFYLINRTNYAITVGDTIPVEPEQPISYNLTNNYPNPFNLETGTRILFTSPTEDAAQVIIYNITGQKIRTLFDGKTQSGENILIWNGRNDSGRQCASGVYFYVLRIAGNEYIKKMVLTK